MTRPARLGRWLCWRGPRHGRGLAARPHPGHTEKTLTSRPPAPNHPTQTPSLRSAQVLFFLTDSANTATPARVLWPAPLKRARGSAARTDPVTGLPLYGGLLSGGDGLPALVPAQSTRSVEHFVHACHLGHCPDDPPWRNAPPCTARGGATTHSTDNNPVLTGRTRVSGR